jgi:YgiT-type zinc finger domain-containing protein
MKCENCRIGRYRPTTLAYVTDLDGEILIIPNVPAYVCGVCRRNQYDPAYMIFVQHLLDQDERAQQPEPWHLGAGSRVS